MKKIFIQFEKTQNTTNKLFSQCVVNTINFVLHYNTCTNCTILVFWGFYTVSEILLENACNSWKIRTFLDDNSLVRELIWKNRKIAFYRAMLISSIDFDRKTDSFQRFFHMNSLLSVMYARNVWKQFLSVYVYMPIMTATLIYGNAHFFFIIQPLNLFLS